MGKEKLTKAQFNEPCDHVDLSDQSQVRCCLVSTTIFCHKHKRKKKDLLTSKQTRKVINRDKNSDGAGKLMKNFFFIIVAVTAEYLGEGGETKSFSY